MTFSNQARMSLEVSPLRHVRNITSRCQIKDTTAYETYCALPSPHRPYNAYDYAIVADILRGAETKVAKAFKKGEGSGIVTLQSVLHAYERVLPRRGIKADEDTYYYRLLLKLSLDPQADWWAKLNRETGTTGGRSAFPCSSPSVASMSTSTRSMLPTNGWQSPSASPVPPSRANHTNASVSGDATLRNSIPTLGGGRVAACAPSSRSSASPARSLKQELRGAMYEVPRNAARLAVAQVERAAAAREPSWDSARETVAQGRARVSRPATPDGSQREAPQNVAAGQAVTWTAAGRGPARDDAARAAAARQAVEAARNLTRQVARAAHARETGARSDGASEAFWDPEDGRVEVMRAPQSEASMPAPTPGPSASQLEVPGMGTVPRERTVLAAREAARQASRLAAVELTAQAQAAAMVASAAVNAARSAAAGSMSVLPPQLAYSGPPGAIAMGSSQRAAVPASRGQPMTLESVDGMSDLQYGDGSDDDRRSSLYTGDEASEYGMASSRYGPALTVGTSAPSNTLGVPRSRPHSPQGGPHGFVPDVYGGEDPNRPAASAPPSEVWRGSDRSSMMRVGGAASVAVPSVAGDMAYSDGQGSVGRTSAPAPSVVSRGSTRMDSEAPYSTSTRTSPSTRGRLTSASSIRSGLSDRVGRGAVAGMFRARSAMSDTGVSVGASSYAPSTSTRTGGASTAPGGGSATGYMTGGLSDGMGASLRSAGTESTLPVGRPGHPGSTSDGQASGRMSGGVSAGLGSGRSSSALAGPYSSGAVDDSRFSGSTLPGSGLSAGMDSDAGYSVSASEYDARASGVIGSKPGSVAGSGFIRGAQSMSGVSMRSGASGRSEARHDSDSYRSELPLANGAYLDGLSRGSSISTVSRRSDGQMSPTMTNGSGAPPGSGTGTIGPDGSNIWTVNSRGTSGPRSTVSHGGHSEASAGSYNNLHKEGSFSFHAGTGTSAWSSRTPSVGTASVVPSVRGAADRRPGGASDASPAYMLNGSGSGMSGGSGSAAPSFSTGSHAVAGPGSFPGYAPSSGMQTPSGRDWAARPGVGRPFVGPVSEGGGVRGHTYRTHQLAEGDGGYAAGGVLPYNGAAGFGADGTSGFGVHGNGYPAAPPSFSDGFGSRGGFGSVGGGNFSVPPGFAGADGNQRGGYNPGMVPGPMVIASSLSMPGISGGGSAPQPPPGGLQSPQAETLPPPREQEDPRQEEAEAYMDFSRMARAFRTWRRNTFTRRTSRSERDFALHNWAVATSFWAVQLLRRCFNRWRGLGPRKAFMAAAVWGDNSRAGCFRRWLIFTRYLRSKSAQCDRLWRGRLLHRTWRRWRVFMWSRRQKARSLEKALSLWEDRTLRSCWRLWRTFVGRNRRKTFAVRRAMAYWTGRWLWACWLGWREFTKTKRRLVLAEKRASARWRSRGLRRCWQEWREFTSYRKRKVHLHFLAMEFWSDSSLRTCWRQWRAYVVTRQRKEEASLVAREFWTVRTLRACIGWWRQFAAKQQHKNIAKGKATHAWTRRVLSGCWLTWQQFTEKQQCKALGVAKAVAFWSERTLQGCFVEWCLLVEESCDNWELSGRAFTRRVLLLWHKAAGELARLSKAHDAIADADHRRLLRSSFQVLLDAHMVRVEQSNRLHAAQARLQRIRLSYALAAWQRARQQGQTKRQRQELALRWANQRCLFKPWNAWRELVGSSHIAAQAAREFAQRALRPMLKEAFYAWVDWHELKMQRRSRTAEACRFMKVRRKHLVLQTWRRNVIDNRNLATAFQQIMRNEVHRLTWQSLQRLRREHDRRRRATVARMVVQREATRRFFNHWKALGKARLAHEQWRAQRVRLVAAQRLRRTLMAWQLIASHHAEQERLVQACLARQRRRYAVGILRAWRDRVLKIVTKRMKMLAALLAWERGVKARAWRSWRLLLVASHTNASRFALAARHHRTRRLGMCFNVLLAHWQTYRGLLARAMVLRTMVNARLSRQVLVAWRQLVGLLRWKNSRLRRALAHSRSRAIAGSLYGWYYVTRHRRAIKQAVTLAVLHWVRRRRAAAFNEWRIWATRQRELFVRVFGYSRLRAARVKARALQVLSANVVRNARIAAAVAHHHRYVSRLVLSGWLLRTLLAAEWVSRLRTVGKQLNRQLLASSLAGWLEYLAYLRSKYCMTQTALKYWQMSRQRSTLDGLRWNATRRQMTRAALQRGRQGAASRVLRAWHEQAVYRRRLRDRYAMVTARSRRTELKRGLERWRAYLNHRTVRKAQHQRAIRHSVRGATRKAWRCWHGYHLQLQRATRHTQSIVRQWQLRDAAEILHVLAEHAAYRRQLRGADAYFARRCAAQTIAAWQEFLLVKRAFDFWSRKRRMEIFSSWQLYTSWQHHLHVIGYRVATRWQRLLARQMLASWRAYAVTSRRLKVLGYTLATRTNKAALGAMLTFWMTFAAESTRLRHISIRIAGRRYTRLLCDILVEWRLVAARLAALQRTGAVITARRHHVLVATAFGCWCLHAANAARLRLAEQQLSDRVRITILRATLGALCAHTARATRLRLASEKVATRVRHATLRGVLSFWCTHTAYKVQQHLILEQVAAHLRQRTASALIRCWRAYAGYKINMRGATQAAANSLRMGKLARSFHTWRAYTAYKTGLRSTARQMWARVQQHTLSRCFGSWRTCAAYKARLAFTAQLLSRRLTLQTMAGAFDGWRLHAAYKSHLYRAEAMVANRLLRNTLGGYFGSWRAYARRMSALKGLLERVLVRVTALAFYGWRELLSDYKHWLAVEAAIQEQAAQNASLKETACYAIVRLRLWPLSVSFYTWYDNANEIRRLREYTTLAVFAYAGSLMRKALATWLAYTLRHRHLRSKLSYCLAAARTKTLRNVMFEWLCAARYLRRLHHTADIVQQKTVTRTLRASFLSWSNTALQLVRLKNILARVMARLLSISWSGWWDAVLESRVRLQALQIIHARRLRRDLRNVMLSWRIVAAPRATAKRLAIKRQRQMLLEVWGAWQEAVYSACLERGGLLHSTQVLRRAVRGWRGVAVELRRGQQLHALMQQRLAQQTFCEWRRQWLARAACRRLYTQRALLGWHELTVELQQARSALWHIRRALLYGCLARCFSAWLQHVQAMTIKRAVFVRKQRALVEALRRGDELAAQRNTEMLEVAFRAWRQRAVIHKQVSQRLTVLRARTLGATLGAWRHVTAICQARNAKHAAVVRHRLIARPFRAWRRATAAAAARAADAVAYRNAALQAAAFDAWRLHHGAVALRCEALRRALTAGAAAAAMALKARVMEALYGCLAQRAAQLELAAQAWRRRRSRVLGSAFYVWLKYTQAMRRGGIDPGSPYLTPREPGTDRKLVTRMAAMAGNEQALSGVSLSASADLLAGLYPSTALQQAMERRQEVAAFLSQARRSASAGRSCMMGGDRPRQQWLRRESSAGSAGGSSNNNIEGTISLQSLASSGAGGADLTDLAAQVVRATPGKNRGPAASLPSHNSPVQPPSRGAAPRIPDLTASPYDDRLDLRALYDQFAPRVGAVGATPAPMPFSGFTAAARQSGDSPLPLGRANATPYTATGPIAPRRIDFTAGRPSATRPAATTPSRAAPIVQQRPHPQPQPSSYGYSTPAAARHGPPYPQPGGRQGSGSGPMLAAARGGGAVGWDADSDDVASITSSDLMWPTEMRSKAAAAAAAMGPAAAAPIAEPGMSSSRQTGLPLGRSPGLGGAGTARQPAWTGLGTGTSGSGGHGAADPVMSGWRPQSRPGGTSFLGGPLARQAMGGATPEGGAAVSGAGTGVGMGPSGASGLHSVRESILDWRAWQG